VRRPDARHLDHPDPSVVQKILSHLGLRTAPLPLARARDPTGQMDLGFDAA
jgi:hypothetical protein